MVNTINGNNELIRFLTVLGFNSDEVKVYLQLLEYGELTKLELSRKSGVNRTKVYRIVEKLISKGLAEEIISSNTTFVRASGLQVLKRMVAAKQSEAETVKFVFPEIESLLLGVRALSDK